MLNDLEIPLCAYETLYCLMHSFTLNYSLHCDLPCCDIPALQ
jgi:hypothetical protein